MKTIWIIGASTGIGAALMKTFQEQGCRVFASARNQEKLAAACNGLSGCHAVPLDVCDVASLNEAAAYIREHVTSIDTLIVNAGTCEYMDSDALDIALVRRVFETNFFGAIQAINTALPLLRSAARPQLVVIGSSVSYQALPRAHAYGASKAAIRYFTECLNIDLQKEGIDVRVVSPGFVDTPLTAQNDFAMPFRISAEQAADNIVKGLEGSSFDVHFPKRFTWLLKGFAKLPQSLRFRMLSGMSRHDAGKPTS
ncbi:MAG: SDR family NAD(P)-dependent oxidoreductase [Oleiphilaceae bacterium]|nr:SDR family NAD(P)-dependent oxidoreductase [Oleiphilaceae bacterium]